MYYHKKECSISGMFYVIKIMYNIVILFIVSLLLIIRYTTKCQCGLGVIRKVFCKSKNLVLDI